MSSVLGKRKSYVGQSMSEILAEKKKKRLCTDKKVKKQVEEGWQVLDLKTHTLEIASTPDRSQSFLKLNFSRFHNSYSDVFLSFFPVYFMMELQQRLSSKPMVYSTKKNMTITLRKVVDYYAARIYIQGNCTPPGPKAKVKNPLRSAFQEATGFLTKYTIVGHDLPGVSFLEAMSSKFVMEPGDERELSRAIQASIVQFGETCSGDEKLVHLTTHGCPYLRMVNSKPDKIGTWEGQMAGQTELGAVIVYDLRSVTSTKSQGEKTPVSSLVKERLDVLKDHRDTILVQDSYYVDTTGRDLLNKAEQLHISALNSKWHKELLALVKGQLNDAGDLVLAYNEKTGESLCYFWDKILGKKFVLSNAFKLMKKKHQAGDNPLYDHYAVGYDKCDEWNQLLHGRRFPFRRSGSGHCLNSHHDQFYFDMVLLNSWQAWADANPQTSSDGKEILNTTSFSTFCKMLSIELVRMHIDL